MIPKLIHLTKGSCRQLHLQPLYRPLRHFSNISMAFATSKSPFQSTKSAIQISQCLQLSNLQLVVSEKGTIQKAVTSRNQLEENLLSSLKIVMNQLHGMMDFLSEKSQKNSKLLSKINLTVSELSFQLNKIIKIIDGLGSQVSNDSEDQLHAKIDFIKGVDIFLSEPFTTFQNNVFLKDFSRLAFIIETVFKLRDANQFYTNYETPLFSKLNQTELKTFFSKIQLIKIKNTQKTAEEYRQFGIIFGCIGGACMASPQSQQSTINDLRLIYEITKSPFNFKETILKSLEMHYRGNFQKILKQLNLVSSGMFKTAFESSCPKIEVNSFIYVPFDSKQDQGWDIFKETNQAIQVRVLAHQELPRHDDPHAKPIEDIMIHMHGGGFCALTSIVSQVFTRDWANQAKIPIFSVDYRLAPAHPFPQGVEDSYRAYEFIVKHIHKYYKITPKNVFVSGQSAGGNLTCGVTALAIKNNILIPKGLYLVFPSLDIRKYFAGSRKHVLRDVLLMPSLVKLATKSYISKENEQSHPLASPLLLTEQFVNGSKGDRRFPLKWPTTYIEIGTDDALRDESLNLMQRMIESNVECKCTLISPLRHGYLNFESAIPSSRGVVANSVRLLKQLIASVKDKNDSL